MTPTVTNPGQTRTPKPSGPIRGALGDLGGGLVVLPKILADALDEYGPDQLAFAWFSPDGRLLRLEVIRKDMPLEHAVRIVAENVMNSEPDPFESVADAIAHVRDTLTLPDVDVPGGFPMTDYNDTASAAYRQVLEASEDDIREAVSRVMGAEQ